MRRLQRSSASAYARDACAEVRQHRERSYWRNLTHVDVDAVAVEDRGPRVVRGDESVELLPVAVPLDAVQLVPLQVVLALQLGLGASHRVLGDDDVHQLDAQRLTCNTRHVNLWVWCG